MAAEQNGFVRVGGHRLFYRSFGSVSGARVVLGLHGGPGGSLDYLLPIADLAERGYRVVLFDQLGCGASEVPDDPELFSLEHHVEETEGVRVALGLGRVHLLGSSYGGLLALAVAVARPQTLRSLTTVGGLASVPFAQREMNRLRAALPPEVREVLDRCEASGATSSPEYARAAQVFYERHLCRLRPFPAELARTLELAAARPVYAPMNGPSEFTITGSIRAIDLAPRLGEIRLPTLVLGGRYDEVTPAVAEQIRQGIPGAQGYTFAESAHVPFWEERALFLDIVADFLRSVDAPGRGGGRVGRRDGRRAPGGRSKRRPRSPEGAGPS